MDAGEAFWEMLSQLAREYGLDIDGDVIFYESPITSTKRKLALSFNICDRTIFMDDPESPIEPIEL